MLELFSQIVLLRQGFQHLQLTKIKTYIFRKLGCFENSKFLLYFILISNLVIIMVVVLYSTIQPLYFTLLYLVLEKQPFLAPVECYSLRFHRLGPSRGTEGLDLLCGNLCEIFADNKFSDITRGCTLQLGGAG